MSQPAYPIRAVARMTGLSLDTLRAWERRYQAVAPRRGDRGRLYANGEVERLKQLARLVDAGHAIGAIAGLSAAALAQLSASAAPRPAMTPPLRLDLVPLLQAMKRYDLPAVDALLGRHAALLPVDEFIFSVVLPALGETGARWEAGSVRPAQEHLIAASMRSMLGALLRTGPPAPAASTMVFATLAGERHELGLLSAAVLAAHRGRRAIFLGTDVPARDLVHAATSLKAAAVVIAATMPQVTPVRELRQLRRLRPETAVWAGGGERAVVRRELGTRAHLFESLPAFAAAADRAAG
jgi:DNA-binding transcriptional MerR regulator